MEYLIGFLLGVCVTVFAALVGFDRDRSFYPTVLIVIGAYYPLFALLAPPSEQPLVLEIAVAVVFLLLAVAGFKRSSWLLVAGMAGHGVFDFFHHRFIENSGVPPWWIGFCLSIDVTLAAGFAVRLITRRGTPNAQS